MSKKPPPRINREESVLREQLGALDEKIKEAARIASDSKESMSLPEQEHRQEHTFLSKQEHRQEHTQESTPLPNRICKGIDKGIHKDICSCICTCVDTTGGESIPDWIVENIPQNPEKRKLTENQLMVYLYLLNEADDGFFNVPAIIDATGLRDDGIRKALKKLKEFGLIYYEQYRRGGFQGFRFVINPNANVNLSKPWRKEHRRKAIAYSTAESEAESGKSGLHSDDDLYINNKSSSGAQSGGDRSDDEPTPSEMRFRDCGVTDMTASDIEILYPALYEIGFRIKHLRDIIASWSRQDLPLNEIAGSLEAANWKIEHNDEGEIEAPLSYVVVSLTRGKFTSPSGFKSRRQLIIEAKLEESNRIAQIADQTLRNNFEHWWAVELSGDERRAIIASMPSYEITSNDQTKKEMLFLRYKKLNHLF